MPPSPSFHSAATHPSQRFQTELMVRGGIYLTLLVAYLWAIQLFTSLMDQPEVGVLERLLSLTDEMAYCLPGLFLMLPLMAYDWGRMSQRMIAPAAQELHRLTAEVAVARGELERLRQGPREDGLSESDTLESAPVTPTLVMPAHDDPSALGQPAADAPAPAASDSAR